MTKGEKRSIKALLFSFLVDLRTSCNVRNFVLRHVYIFEPYLMLFIYVFSMPSYSCLNVICECFEFNLNVVLSICCVWKNRRVRFSKPDGPVFLVNPDVPVCQTGVSGFGRHNI